MSENVLQADGKDRVVCRKRELLRDTSGKNGHCIYCTTTNHTSHEMSE